VPLEMDSTGPLSRTRAFSIIAREDERRLKVMARIACMYGGTILLRLVFPVWRKTQ
jgi:hypothetical protein